MRQAAAQCLGRGGHVAGALQPPTDAPIFAAPGSTLPEMLPRQAREAACRSCQYCLRAQTWCVLASHCMPCACRSSPGVQQEAAPPQHRGHQRLCHAACGGEAGSSSGACTCTCTAFVRPRVPLQAVAQRGPAVAWQRVFPGCPALAAHASPLCSPALLPPPPLPPPPTPTPAPRLEKIVVNTSSKNYCARAHTHTHTHTPHPLCLRRRSPRTRPSAAARRPTTATSAPTRSGRSSSARGSGTTRSGWCRR